jgi:hypothetical protein
MEKNWLIRTRSNHILGPVSKEKVMELYQNGSIKPDDEICSGNGYWFFIRETDLVNRFLMGRESQGFNPISEAKDVLTMSEARKEKEITRDDITTIGSLNFHSLNQNLNKATDIQKESVEPLTPAIEKVKTSEIPEKKNKTESRQAQSVKANKLKKQNYIQYLGVFVFIILFLIIYYRKLIVRSFFEQQSSLKNSSTFFISDVYAQDENQRKKKNFLIQKL